MERSRNLQGIFILLALLALGGLYLWQNIRPGITVSVPAPTATTGDVRPPDWEVELRAQLASAATLLPTVDPNAPTLTAPALPTGDPAEGVILAPDAVGFTPWPTSTITPTPALPTAAGPTAIPSPTGLPVASNVTPVGYQPPPEEAPLRLHVNDHYWMKRPVDASANSESLFYYPFGSDGPRNEWRVHHGVDMPNPIGEQVHAVASGTVIWANNGAEALAGAQQGIYPAYGNVVVIEHDIGYRGQKLWTLYAHLSAILTEQGAHVEQGDTIGLIGGTGDVSGPHVHLEIRLGENNYYAVLNPLLWIVPYVEHGVVAGRAAFIDGTPAEDVTITLTQRGRVIQTTTTYIAPKRSPNQRSGWEVNPDPAWQENFALGDVPAGDYTISVTLNGRRYAQDITVRAGTTNFVLLGSSAAATSQAPGS